MKQRLIRVLVYEGTPEFIEDCWYERQVRKSVLFPDGIIREKVLGDYPKIPLTSDQDEPETFSMPTGSPSEAAEDFSALR